MLPAVSTARTSTWCGPSARANVVNGLTQASKGPASTLHSNLANPGSSEPKVKVGVLSPVFAPGPVTPVVFGAVRSGSRANKVTALSLDPEA